MSTGSRPAMGARPKSASASGVDAGRDDGVRAEVRAGTRVVGQVVRRAHGHRDRRGPGREDRLDQARLLGLDVGRERRHDGQTRAGRGLTRRADVAVRGSRADPHLDHVVMVTAHGLGQRQRLVHGRIGRGQVRWAWA